ncbi:hypothetical protein IWW47_000907 [Coemansia sp. RSA 2052]|nr:hypothetical protein IWW47_000907 [Coemansia sp. RSA 2052]
MLRQFARSTFYKAFQCHSANIDAGFRLALDEARAPQAFVEAFFAESSCKSIVGSSVVSTLIEDTPTQEPSLNYKFSVQQGSPDYTCSLEVYSDECKHAADDSSSADQ